MSNEEYILNHYKRLAGIHGLCPKMSMEDSFVREAEGYFFISEVQELMNSGRSTSRLLDLGCGNGYTLELLQERFPKIQLSGMEFSPELFDLCLERKLKNVTFIKGDMRIESILEGPYDVIITQRSIINILSWEGQAKALKNIAQNLKPGGFYLMVESFKGPWLALNEARAEVGCNPLPMSRHNRYLKESVVDSLAEWGLNECETEISSNFLSSHFFITRVFDEQVRAQNEQKKRNGHWINFFREAIPPGIGRFSPITFRKFQKDKNV